MTERMEEFDIYQLNNDMQSVLWGEPYYHHTEAELEQFKVGEPSRKTLIDYDIVSEASAIAENAENHIIMVQGQEYATECITDAFQ